MKKFIFVLFEILGLALKMILLFSLFIVGYDLIVSRREAENPSSAETE